MGTRTSSWRARPVQPIDRTVPRERQPDVEVGLEHAQDVADPRVSARRYPHAHAHAHARPIITARRQARSSRPRRARCGFPRRRGLRPDRRRRRSRREGAHGRAHGVELPSSWFETTMPSTPASTERRASSGSSTHPDHQPAVEVLSDPRDVIRGGARFELGRNHALNAARVPARGTASSRLPNVTGLQLTTVSRPQPGWVAMSSSRAEPSAGRGAAKSALRTSRLRAPATARSTESTSTAERAIGSQAHRAHHHVASVWESPIAPRQLPNRSLAFALGHVPERLRTDGIDDRGAPRSVRDPRARAECPSRTADLTQHAP